MAARMTVAQLQEKMGTRIIDLEKALVERETQVRDLEARLLARTPTTTGEKLREMLETKEEILRQHKEMHAAQLAERDTKIAELEAQLAASRRPVARLESPAVKALPMLQVAEGERKVACPLNAEHGRVTPNVKGRCPLCFTEATRAAAMANYEARTA